MHQNLMANPNLADLPPKPVNPRYNSLDHWRGIGCLLIVALHAVFFAKVGMTDAEMHTHRRAAQIYNMMNTYFGLGVPMFFVLSGYCIAATADSTRRKSNATRKYFFRRLRRIYPPYWAAIILALAVSGMVAMMGKPMLLDPSTTAHTPYIPAVTTLKFSQWLGSATLTEQWRFHLGGPALQQYLGPAWTLCYEEQFYVVCGLILLFSRRRMFLGATVVSIATIVTAFIAERRGVSLRGFFFDGRWMTFAAGVFVYYHLNYKPAGWKKALVPAVLAAMILSCWGLGHRYGDSLPDETQDLLYSIFVGTIFAVILLAGRPLDGWVSKSKLLAPFGACGRMCYSLYLIHWIVCVVLGRILLDHGIHGLVPVLKIYLPILMATSLLCAWAFYMLVERHFLNPPSSAADKIAKATGPSLVPVGG